MQRILFRESVAEYNTLFWKLKIPLRGLDNIVLLQTVPISRQHQPVFLLAPAPMRSLKTPVP